MKLSVIMPVYNEEATVKDAVSRVMNVKLPVGKELIIVDDGSTDGTKSILKNIIDPAINVIFHKKNKGKGAALNTGFANVTGDIIVIQDADMEYDPADFIHLINPILYGSADVVYGSRFLSGPHRVLLFWHFVGNKLITLAADILYNINLSDIETGYKAFKKDVLEKIKFSSKSFGFEAEFTAKVAKRRYRIFEVPIQYSGRTYEEGKKITWRDGIIALCILLKYRFCG